MRYNIIMRYEELGIRMKSFEYQTTCNKLIPQLPIIARIDGRAFHTFCKGLQKPFCMELVETMQEVCKHLVFETKAQLGYVQSDEISLCWLSYDKAPFNGKLFKLQSVLSSMATAKFNNYITTTYFTGKQIQDTMSHITEVASNEVWKKLFHKCIMLNPSFDCRVFQVPNEVELANYFVWRELDAVRNSVQMVAQANFSHNSLQGLNSKDLQNKLLVEKNINWNNLPDELKRGSYYKRVLVLKELEDEVWNKIPQDKKPESRMVTRSQIQLCKFPIMKDVSNKVDVYFNDMEPIYKKVVE